MGTVIKQTLPVVDAIAARMAERRVGVRTVAEQLGVSHGTVHNWLNANYAPPLNAEMQQRLAAFLKVSPRQVVELYGLDVSSDASGGSRRRAA